MPRTPPAAARHETPIQFVVHAGQDLRGGSRPGAGATRAAPSAMTRALDAAHAQRLPAGLAHGELLHSVSLGVSRGGTRERRDQRMVVSAVPGRDVVVLHLAGGPSLVLHPEHARDLLRAQQPEWSRSRAARVTGAAAQEVDVPTELRWPGLEASAVAIRGAAARGTWGQALLSGLDIVRGAASAAQAAVHVAAQVDAQVVPGLYALQRQQLFALKDSSAKPIAALPAAVAAQGPVLVLVHGTFSHTAQAFADLWTQHPQRVAALFDHYGQRVYALEHATLGVSPVANALALAKSLPRHTQLHLLTHSRGGLVAEVLARVAANPRLVDEDLSAFGADDQRDLRALGRLLVQRQLSVRRIVRVACPARGTLLASKRLDAYLSVLKWTLERASVPVLPALVDLLATVAAQRADPMTLPGLAAQVPGSALIQWLHAADAPVPGDLRVVAGDVQADSVGSWLKTLLSDGFYWTDNDFVVQTRSMYGGAPRAAGASFLLDRGARVSHGGYFANERTAEAVCNALTQDEPAGFAPIGPLSWAGESASGLRGAPPARRGAAAASDRPAVILLPGIAGSHLAVNDKRIWLSWRLVAGLKRLAYPDAPGQRVTPDGAIGPVYDDLARHLADTHEVIEFSFDWRRPIEDEARRLAQVVQAALAARQASAAPVRFVAHSMGGLVVRTMALEAPEVFASAMKRPGARVLMLGTPNGGSWAPMQVLSGDDTFGNTLASVGAPFQDHAARQLMAQMPGFLQLQAGLTDHSLQLDDEKTWQELAARDLATVREYNWWHSDAAQLEAYTWGVPSAAVLRQARALRERLDAQRDGDLARFAHQCVLVVGHAKFTPDGFELGPEGLAYRNATDAGDGRVTRASARLPGVRTWTVDCEHGDLADHEKAFTAYTELLVDGHTERLTRLPDLATDRADPAPPSTATPRGAPPALITYTKSRPSRQWQGLRPPAHERELSTPSTPESALATPHVPGSHSAALPALAVTVVNAHLMFVAQPLMVGHYRASSLTGSEAAINSLIGGGMAESLNAGLYPDAAGSFQMFRNTRGSDNPLQLPRPQWVIVVGLGEESDLKPATLQESVRQGIVGWAQRLTESSSSVPPTFEMAATLVGSGGTRITPGQSAQLMVQAAREANLRLRASGWPLLSHLLLVELYLDRASEAWRALRVVADTRPQDWRITGEVNVRAGALRRPLDSGYRGADYDLICATSVNGSGHDASIAYTLDTRRARAEVRAQATQARLVHEMVKRAANDRQQDPQIGQSLYQLLVPVEMDPFMGGATETLIEVDAGTAGIPWELLHNNTDAGDVATSDEALPWAVRTKLLRRLRTTRFRQTVRDAGTDGGALVIGEPAVGTPGDTTTPAYPRLPGARREARAVADRLQAAGALGPAAVTRLIADEDPASAPEATQVINALLQRDWRIVHIAGHGEPPERVTGANGQAQAGDPRGVVLSLGCFLGPREIRTMRTVPELVFINCCFLAERSPEQLLRAEGATPGYDRSAFAATVAEELIKIGVRCVIAAGWAVEDAPAEAFARTFYDALLSGARFIDAAARARRVAWEQRGGGNTWAAYQCYGDPEWTLRLDEGPKRARPPAERYSGTASPVSLTIALETVAVEARHLRADDRERGLALQRERLTYLDARYGPQWGAMGAVAEAFGVAWTEVGDTACALQWLERALAANDASASHKAAELWANLRARDAEASVRLAAQALAQATTPTPRAARADKQAQQRAAAALTRAATRARRPLTQSLQMIQRLLGLHETMERHALAGATCKRMALVEAAIGAHARALAATRRMKTHYQRAEALALATADPQLFYPALNRMEAELVTDAPQARWRGFDAHALAAVRRSLLAKTRDDPDFWSVAGLTELQVYEAVAARALAPVAAPLADEFAQLQHRVSGVRYWRSMYDTARFVLQPYADRATPTEARASRDLVDTLRRFAWPG